MATLSPHDLGQNDLDQNDLRQNTLGTATLVSATRPPRRQRSRDGSAANPMAGFASRFGVMAVLVIAAVYFLLPIWWLLVASTKPAGRQFVGNGLWFDGFGLIENVAAVCSAAGCSTASSTPERPPSSARCSRRWPAMRSRSTASGAAV